MTNATQVNEPLPCPCCSSGSDYVYEDNTWHLVRCVNRKCGLQSGIFPTKPMAIKAWNTRAPSPAALAPGNAGAVEAWQMDLLLAAKALLAEIELRPGGYDFRPYYELRARSQLNDPDAAVIRLQKAVAAAPLPATQGDGKWEVGKNGWDASDEATRDI